MSLYKVWCIKYVFIVFQAIATVTTASVVLAHVRTIIVTTKDVYPVSGHRIVLLNVAKAVVVKHVINWPGIAHLAMTVIMMTGVHCVVIRTV